MTKLNLEFGEEVDYDGSKVFQRVADYAGISVDLTNFLITQFLALFLASLFRSHLHPSKVSARCRHAFALFIGLFFGYFCFGSQAIHIINLPAICYIAMLTQNPLIVQRIVMVVALSYLSCIHLHRQYNSNGAYTVDITGPLMIITQKVTSLAFSLHDGYIREKKELSNNQKYHMIEKIPSPLEYFSYVLNFQSLFAGPLIFYRDYIDFIEGNIMSGSSTSGKLESTNKIIQEPSPTKTVVKKVLSSVVCAYIYIKLINVYPIKDTKEDEFINNTSIFYKFWYLHMMTMAVRFKYYFAWIFADAIVNNAGLGFNGFEESDGTQKWDMCTNIYVINFELGTNFRDCINSWNIGTNIWLRNVVYERVPKKHGTILTFALSALWHGFYPGYYLTFATGAIFVTAARKARRMFRHKFQETELSRTSYDVITCLVTRTFMTYATFPFVLLELGVSLRLYLKLFVCLHLIGLLTIYVLPNILPSGGKKGEKHSRSVDTNNKKGHNSASTSFHSKSNELSEVINKRPITSNKSDQIEQDDSSNFSSSCSSSFNNSMNDISKDIGVNGQHQHQVRKADTNYLLKDLISKEVNKLKDETGNLSNLLKEKIEAANIEGFIDKTVCGFVELKDDLMRMNEPEVYGPNAVANLKKLNKDLPGDEAKATSSISVADSLSTKNVDAFLKKDANVIPVVLSNANSAK